MGRNCLGEMKLQGHFGEKIVIITVDNRNVVTFRSTVATIISELYKQRKVDDYEVEQIRIVAGLKKVWIRHLYSPNVSLLLLQSPSSTASGFTNRYSSVELLRSRKSDCGSQRCSCKKKKWNGLLGCMWYRYRK